MSTFVVFVQVECYIKTKLTRMAFKSYFLHKQQSFYNDFKTNCFDCVAEKFLYFMT